MNRSKCSPALQLALYGKEFKVRMRDGGAKRSQKAKRTSYEWKRFNVECAAQFLVYDLFTSLRATGAKRIQLLRPDGVRLAFPLGLLSPHWFWSVSPESPYAEALGAEARRRGKEPSRLYLPIPSFDVEALSHDYWVFPFLESQAFVARGGFTMNRFNQKIELMFPVVNWDTGCIDLQAHRTYLESVKGFRRVSVHSVAWASTTFRNRQRDSHTGHPTMKTL